MNENKIAEIQKKIDRFKQKKTATKEPKSSSNAFNIAIEIVAGMIVGLIMGIFFDNLFDSKPIFLIICMVLAMIATFRSIWKKNVN